MWRRYLKRLPQCLVSLLALCSFGATLHCGLAIAQPTRPRVVILNSYHYGFDWSDHEMDGLLATLRQAYPDLDPAIEFLDTKHFTDHPYLEDTAGYLTRKYQGLNVDLVVALDNLALEMAVSNRHRLFPQAKLLFTGINNFHPEMLAGQKGVTGVAEDTDVVGTLELMLKLHPQTKRVFAIHDYSPAGLASRADLNRSSFAFKERLEFSFAPLAGFPEILDRLRSLRPDTLVLLLSYAGDGLGSHLSPSETASQICQASPVPVYALHEYRLGQGVVGGRLLSGKHQGQQVGQLALRVLAGEDPSKIPVIRDSPAPPMFDYVQLARFGIPLSALPPESRLINQPVSFFEQYRVLVLSTSVVVAVLASLVFLLTWSLLRARRAGIRLKTGEKRYRQLFDDASDGIMIVNDQGLIVDHNHQFRRMLDYQPEEIQGKHLADLIDPRDLERQPISMTEVNAGRILRVERPMRRKDGEYLILEIQARRMGPDVIQALCRDITTRKRAEAALRESEERYRVLFEGTTQGILAADAETSSFVVANPAICSMLGHTQEELLRLDVSRIHPPEALGEVMAAFQAMVRMELTQAHGLPVLRKDGTIFYANIAAAHTVVNARPCAVGFFTDVTDHKVAEDELRKSEERFRAIFDSSFQFAGVLTTDGKVVQANRSALEFAGVGQEAVIGKMFWETPWWKGNSLQAQELEDAVARAAQGQVVRMEVENRGADGQLAILDFSIKPVRDTSGEVVLLIPEGRDITSRKKMEEELRANRDRLKVAQEIAHIGNWEINLATGQIWGSEEAFKIYGLDLTLDQILPLEMVQSIPLDEDRPRLDEALRRLLQEGTGYDLEFRFCRASDGMVRDAHSKAELVKDASGVAIKVLGTIQDITHRKLMEQSLRLTQISFDSASIGIFRIGDNGRILSVNNAACQSLQYSKEELLTMSVFDIDPAFPRVRWEGHIKDLRKTGNKTIETTHRRKNGEIFPVEIIISFVRFGDEEFHLAFVQDITERQRLRTERESLETQLAQSQKMEAIGTLAGGIAHDFNNILAAIIGYTELAQRSCRQNVEACRGLEQVLSASERARSLVRQILMFSRKSEAKKEPVKINDIITSTMAMLQRTIPKMVTIETKLAPSIPLVMADPSQMEQLVMNLVVNANDAMPEGGRLLVETQAIDLDINISKKVLDVLPGPYLLITFSDTGHGMDQETVHHIFDPFFTTKEIGKGTGLGLSTVYGIAKGHGGRVTCYSEVGVGTVFKVYLPLHTGEVAAETKPETRDEAELRGYETILLVDDEEVLRELGAERLMSMGYEVLTAGSGEAALQIYQEMGQKVDLVLLDLGLPGMGGKRCLEELLSIDPKVKVVIASGYSSREQIKASRAMGAAGFVAKPFGFLDLLGTVRSVLNGD